MRYIVLAILLWGVSITAQAKAPQYDIDKSHTSIQFYVAHAGFSKMIGEFNEYDGYFTFDSAKPETSFVKITLYPKGIDTGHQGLNDHLQNADFFNSNVHPKITFVSTDITKTGSNTGTVTGDFTMLGITQPLTLDVTFNKEGTFFGRHRAGFSMRGSLKRSEFGMSYGLPDTIGDEVDIVIEVEGVRLDS